MSDPRPGTAAPSLPQVRAGVSLSRRTLLSSASLALLGQAAPDAATAISGVAAQDASRPIEYGPLRLRDPLERLESVMRIERTLEEHEVSWWYQVSWLLIVPERAPAPLIRYELMEMSRHRRERDNRFIVHGHNVGFARDYLSGEYTSEIRNPLTGARIAAGDVAILDDPGYEFSAQGVRPLNGQPLPPPQELWRVEDELLHLERVRGAPAGWCGQFLEQHITTVSLKHYRDLTKSQLPARGFGSWLQPAPAWLGIAAALVFGQFHGRKLDGLWELPRDYFERLERDYPQFLKVNENKFRCPAAAQRHA
jgi:hypothetical protein